LIIDDPTLLNDERLQLAADNLEAGAEVSVWLLSMAGDEVKQREQLVAVLCERGHEAEVAEILACGCHIYVEPSA
jgi:hypothetical protein